MLAATPRELAPALYAACPGCESTMARDIIECACCSREGCETCLALCQGGCYRNFCAHCQTWRFNAAVCDDCFPDFEPGFYLRQGMHWLSISPVFGGYVAVSASPDGVTRFDTRADAERAKAALDRCSIGSGVVIAEVI